MMDKQVAEIVEEDPEMNNSIPDPGFEITSVHSGYKDGCTLEKLDSERSKSVDISKKDISTSVIRGEEVGL
jgi:hypothetical protein